jgi:hypothetical protein
MQYSPGTDRDSKTRSGAFAQLVGLALLCTTSLTLAGGLDSALRAPASVSAIVETGVHEPAEPALRSGQPF